jgi:hypothetical protein
MELSQRQFESHLPNSEAHLTPLNRQARKQYPQLSEQLSLFIKQARLAKLKQELGEN